LKGQYYINNRLNAKVKFLNINIEGFYSAQTASNKEMY